MRRRASAAGGAWAFIAILVACGNADRPPTYGDLLNGSSGRDDAGDDAPFVLPPQVAPDDDPATCSDAAASRSYVGCDYWPTVVANDVWSIFDYAVVVANAGAGTASVTVTGPLATHQTQTVAPNTLATFYLPWVPELKGQDADACGASAPLLSTVISKGGAYHLMSSVPVTVYQFNALEYVGAGGPSGKSWSTCEGLQQCNDMGLGQPLGCFSFSNDASLLLPSTAMTGSYRVAELPGQTQVDPTGQTPPAPAMNGYFAITATVDGTNVTVRLSPTGSVLAGDGVPATPGGGTITLVMDAGDVAEIAGDLGDTVDLSGSLVSADQPVQVIAGAPCDEVPEQHPACDHIEQSVFPAETLGTHYFVTVPSGPYGRPIGHVVRFFGNADGTVLTYLPAAPAGCPATLDEGQVGDCGIVQFDFQVSGTHEFAVGSFMLGGSIVDPMGGLGDPSASFMAAVEQYRTKYVFLAPSDYETNFADIVAPSGTTVFLDGHAIDTTGRPVAGGYVVVHGVNLGSRGAHVLAASAPIGLQVLGYGSFTSYQYPGGLNLKRIAPPPVLH